jgi:hypothetical protein
MKKSLCLMALMIFMSFARQAFSQEINQEKLIRMRDSLDNLLIVNPSASAILVKSRQVEAYLFGSFLSNKEFNDKEGKRSAFPGKQLLFNTLLQINYGISPKGRLNVGIDMSYRSYRYDNSKDNSVFSVLGGNPSNVNSLAYIGPRIRLQPFKRVYNFTYQMYAWLPVADEFTQRSLGTSKINWGHTFFYYKYFNQRIGLFAQANLALAFPGAASEADATTEFYLPISLSASYVLSRKNILFATVTYSRINNDAGTFFEGADSDFVQYGLGYQRIISRRFFFNLSYNGTIMSRNYGAWNAFNVGVRYQF